MPSEDTSPSNKGTGGDDSSRFVPPIEDWIDDERLHPGPSSVVDLLDIQNPFLEDSDPAVLSELAQGLQLSSSEEKDGSVGFLINSTDTLTDSAPQIERRGSTALPVSVSRGSEVSSLEGKDETSGSLASIGTILRGSASLAKRDWKVAGTSQADTSGSNPKRIRYSTEDRTASEENPNTRKPKQELCKDCHKLKQSFESKSDTENESENKKRTSYKCMECSKEKLVIPKKNHHCPHKVPHCKYCSTFLKQCIGCGKECLEGRITGFKEAVLLNMHGRCPNVIKRSCKGIRNRATNTDLSCFQHNERADTATLECHVFNNDNDKEHEHQEEDITSKAKTAQH